MRDGEIRSITIQDGDPEGKNIIIVDDLVQVFCMLLIGLMVVVVVLLAMVPLLSQFFVNLLGVVHALSTSALVNGTISRPERLFPAAGLPQSVS